MDENRDLVHSPPRGEMTTSKPRVTTPELLWGAAMGLVYVAIPVVSFSIQYSQGATPHSFWGWVSGAWSAIAAKLPVDDVSSVLVTMMLLSPLAYVYWAERLHKKKGIDKDDLTKRTDPSVLKYTVVLCILSVLMTVPLTIATRSSYVPDGVWWFGGAISAMMFLVSVPALLTGRKRRTLLLEAEERTVHKLTHEA